MFCLFRFGLFWFGFVVVVVVVVVCLGFFCLFVCLFCFVVACLFVCLFVCLLPLPTLPLPYLLKWDCLPCITVMSHQKTVSTTTTTTKWLSTNPITSTAYFNISGSTENFASDRSQKFSSLWPCDLKTPWPCDPVTLKPRDLVTMWPCMKVRVIKLISKCTVRPCEISHDGGQKTTSKSGLALNGILYYGKTVTARSGESWLLTLQWCPNGQPDSGIERQIDR